MPHTKVCWEVGVLMKPITLTVCSWWRHSEAVDHSIRGAQSKSGPSIHVHPAGRAGKRHHLGRVAPDGCHAGPLQAVLHSKHEHRGLLPLGCRHHSGVLVQIIMSTHNTCTYSKVHTYMHTYYRCINFMA